MSGLEGSYEDLVDDINDLLRTATRGNDCWCSVVSTFSDYVIYDEYLWDGDHYYWKQPYKLVDGEPVFEGVAEQLEIDFVPVGTGQYSDNDDEEAPIAPTTSEKANAGVDRPDSDFAYVEPGHAKDGKTPNKFRHYPIYDKAHVRNALARLEGDQSPFAPKAKRKVMAAARKMGIAVDTTTTKKAKKEVSLLNKIRDVFGSMKGSGQSAKAFYLTKDADGRTRFFCIPTNNYRDREAELFTAAAHKEAIQWMDDAGVYPELWLWHIKGTKFGQVDMVDFVEGPSGVGGVVVASGLIDSGKEALAEELAHEDVAMSHGFVGLLTKEDKAYTQYRSWEYSVLPRQYVANYGTAYNMVVDGMKEGNMPLTDNKRAFLREHGATEADVKSWEGATDEFNKSLGAMAQRFNIDAKSLGLDEKAKADAGAAADDKKDDDGDESADDMKKGASKEFNTLVMEELVSTRTAMKGVVDAITGVKTTFDTDLAEVKALVTEAKSIVEGAKGLVPGYGKGMAGNAGYVASGAKDNHDGDKGQGAPEDTSWFQGAMSAVATSNGTANIPAAVQ